MAGLGMGVGPIGRENSIFIAFILEASAVYVLLHLINRPVWFVVLSGYVSSRAAIFSCSSPRLRRPVRELMGHHLLWDRVHCQVSGCSLCRARRRLDVCQDRFLDEGLLGDECARSGGCVHGAAVAEASVSPHRQRSEACRFRLAM